MENKKPQVERDQGREVDIHIQFPEREENKLSVKKKSKRMKTRCKELQALQKSARQIPLAIQGQSQQISNMELDIVPK